MIKLGTVLDVMDPTDHVSINLFSSCCEEEQEVTGVVGTLKLILHPFVLGCEIAQIYSEDGRVVCMVSVDQRGESKR